MTILGQAAIVYSYTFGASTNPRARVYGAMDFRGNNISLTEAERNTFTSNGMPVAIHYSSGLGPQAVYQNHNQNGRATLVNLDDEERGSAFLFHPAANFKYWGCDARGEYLCGLALEETALGLEGVSYSFRLHEMELGDIIGSVFATASDVRTAQIGSASSIPSTFHPNFIHEDFQRATYNSTRIFTTGRTAYVWFFDRQVSPPNGFVYGVSLNRSGRRRGEEFDLFKNRLLYSGLYSDIRPIAYGSQPFTALDGSSQYFQYWSDNDSIWSAVGTTSEIFRFASSAFGSSVPRSDVRMVAGGGYLFAAQAGTDTIKRWDASATGSTATNLSITPSTENIDRDRRIVDIRLYIGKDTYVPPTQNVPTIIIPPPTDDDTVDDDDSDVDVADDDVPDDMDEDVTPPVPPATPPAGSSATSRPGAVAWLEPAQASSSLAINRTLSLRLNVEPNVTQIPDVYVRRRVRDPNGSNHGAWYYLNGTVGTSSGQVLGQSWSARRVTSVTNTNGSLWHPGRFRNRHIRIHLEPDWHLEEGEVHEFQVRIDGITTPGQSVGGGPWNPGRLVTASSLFVEAPTWIAPANLAAITPDEPLLLDWGNVSGEVEYVRIQRRLQGSSTVYEYYDGFTPLLTPNGEVEYGIGAYLDGLGSLSVVYGYNPSNYLGAFPADLYSVSRQSFLPMWIDFATFSVPAELSGIQNGIRNEAQANYRSAHLLGVTSADYSPVNWDRTGLRFDGWGLHGNTYEFRVAYQSFNQVMSEFSDWRAVICRRPTPAKPTIVDPEDGHEQSPDIPLGLTVRIPTGVTATTVQLRQRDVATGETLFWLDDGTNLGSTGWSSRTHARSLPQGSYTNDVRLGLTGNWQPEHSEREYSAAYTTATLTEFDNIGHGAEITIHTTASEFGAPDKPVIVSPEDFDLRNVTEPLPLEFDIPDGQIGRTFRVRRRRRTVVNVPVGGTVVRYGDYEYWSNVGQFSGWSRDENAIAIPLGQTLVGRVEHELRGNWQEAGETWELSVAYLRFSDGRESEWSDGVHVETRTNSVPRQPVITAPEPGSTHDASSALTFEVDLPAGETTDAVWIQHRRRVLSSRWNYRNASNTDWITEVMAGIPAPIRIPSSTGDFELDLPAGWQDTGVPFEYRVAFRGANGIQSLWSNPITVWSTEQVVAEGVVLYRREGYDGLEAIDFNGNEISFSAGAEAQLASWGFPQIIHGGNAYYLTSEGHVYAFSMTTGIGRTVLLKDSGALAVTGLCSNEDNTRAYAIERIRIGSTTGLQLVCWNLPDFTNRAVIEQGTRAQALGTGNIYFVDNVDQIPPARRVLTVTDNYAFYVNWVIPLNGSAANLFAFGSPDFQFLSPADDNIPGTIVAAALDSRFYSIGADIHFRNSTDPLTTTAARVVDDAFVSGRIFVEATAWHIWSCEWVTDDSDAAQIAESQTIKRWNHNGTNPQSYNVGHRVYGIKAYTPTGSTYELPPTPDAAPTWVSPAENAQLSPHNQLELEFATPVVNDRVAIQRRVDGTSTWHGWGVTDLGVVTWIPNDETLWSYQPGLTNEYRLPQYGWGESGVRYEFRVRFRNASNRTLSAWSSVRHVRCDDGVGAQLSTPVLNAPQSGPHPLGESLTFSGVVPAQTDSQVLAVDVFLYKRELGSEDWERIDFVWRLAGQQLVNPASGPFSWTIRADDEWQPPGSTCQYAAICQDLLTNDYSALSNIVTIMAVSQDVFVAPVEVTPFEDLTPHAPTWSTTS